MVYIEQPIQIYMKMEYALRESLPNVTGKQGQIIVNVQQAFADDLNWWRGFRELKGTQWTSCSRPSIIHYIRNLVTGSVSVCHSGCLQKSYSFFSYL